MHIAFVGGGAVQRDGAEHRIAGGLEDDRLFHIGQAEAAELTRKLRAEQAGIAGVADQFAAQIVGRAMLGPPGVAFARDHYVVHEGARAFLQRDQRRGKTEIHVASCF